MLYPSGEIEKKKSFNYTNFIEMRNDCNEFYDYTRMTVESFDELLSLIEDHLMEGSSRKSICAEERLAVTIQ